MQVGDLIGSAMGSCVCWVYASGCSVFLVHKWLCFDQHSKRGRHYGQCSGHCLASTEFAQSLVFADDRAGHRAQ